MERKVWTMASGVAAALSFSAAVLLMMPVEFQRADNIEKGPMSVKIDWFNLGCKIPSPNLDLRESTVRQYWRLPENVRLSSRMVRIGRCAVAVSNRNQKSETKIDGSVCYGACFWWVPSVAIVALVISIVSFGYFASGLVNWKRKYFTQQEFDSNGRWEMIRAVAFAGTFLMYALDSTNEFTYTKYGDIYPTNYFDIQPITWIVGWWLYLAAICTQTLSFYAVTAMITKRATATSSSKRDESTGQGSKKSDDEDRKTSDKDDLSLNSWFAAKPSPVKKRLLATPSPSPPELRLIPRSISPPHNANMSDCFSVMDSGDSGSDADSISLPWLKYRKERTEANPFLQAIRIKQSSASAEKKESDGRGNGNKPKDEVKNVKRQDKTEMEPLISGDVKKQMCQDKNDKGPEPDVKKEVPDEKGKEPKKDA